MKRSSGPKVCLLVCLSLATYTSQHGMAMPHSDAPSGSSHVASSGAQQYLFPVLPFGPNNQKRDLRFALGLAKQLGTGIILTGIHKHHADIRQMAVERQRARKASMQRSGSHSGMSVMQRSRLPVCFNESAAGYMPMESVIDRRPLQAWVPTVTVSELRHQWNGKLDVLVYRSDSSKVSMDKYIQRSLKAANVTLPDTAHAIVIEEPLDCDLNKIGKLKYQLQPYRYIAVLNVLLGSNEKTDLIAEAAQTPPQQWCERSVYEANRLLRPAPWLRSLARQYIANVLGSQIFMAVHVRPFPDTCLEAWRDKNFLSHSTNFSVVCRQPHWELHKRLGPCVAEHFKASGANVLFVLAHPSIRGTVDKLLAEAGIEGAHYLHAQHVQRLAACDDNSATSLLLVEESIAAMSSTFLGTDWSSISHTIIYQRWGMGRNDNHLLEHLKC